MDRAIDAISAGPIVTLTAPATDGDRLLDRFLRVQTAWSNASLRNVMYVADRLSPLTR